MEACILVVKDTNATSQQLKHTIEKIGCKAIFVRNAIEALRLLEHIIPDIIIVDLIMPKVSALEFIRQVRKLPKLNHLPILMFSIYSDPLDEEAKMVGATHILKNQ